jgi:hypothetical protein
LFCYQSKKAVQGTFKVLDVSRFFNHVVSEVSRQFSDLHMQSVNRTFQTFYTMEKLEKRLSASDEK